MNWSRFATNALIQTVRPRGTRTYEGDEVSWLQIAAVIFVVLLILFG